jgi:hypothetical protein
MNSERARYEFYLNPIVNESDKSALNNEVWYFKHTKPKLSQENTVCPRYLNTVMMLGKIPRPSKFGPLTQCAYTFAKSWVRHCTVHGLCKYRIKTFTTVFLPYAFVLGRILTLFLTVLKHILTVFKLTVRKWKLKSPVLVYSITGYSRVITELCVT